MSEARAEQIWALANQLNAAIEQGHKEGLRVEVDVQETHYVTERWPRPRIVVQLSRAV